MSKLFFHPDYEDSGGPTPLSWRFGEYRRWHPTCDFLYEIRKDGQIMWAPCLTFRDSEVKVVRPARRSLTSPPNHTVEHGRSRDTV